MKLSDPRLPHLIGVVWCDPGCCWDRQGGSLWTRRSLGRGCHWQHTAWWLSSSAPPPSAGDPCQYWGSRMATGPLERQRQCVENEQKCYFLGKKRCRRIEMRKCEIAQMHKLLVFLWPQRQAYAVNAFFPSSQMKPNTHSHTLSPLPPPSQLTSAGSWEVEILARTLEPLYPPASKQRVLPTAS